MTWDRITTTKNCFKEVVLFRLAEKKSTFRDPAAAITLSSEISSFSKNDGALDLEAIASIFFYWLCLPNIGIRSCTTTLRPYPHSVPI